jgi:multidrug efflux pump subunit AcrA (membrane-fusion protein)
METNALPPGASVVGWLNVPGENEDGLIVPASALVRHEGATFIFTAKGDDLFSRTEIELERPMDQGWLVKGEVKPGEKIVITGAQQLLSEELKAQNSEE